MVKFLLIRFSSIGDIVLTTPLVRCLKQQVEGAEVHYLTKKQFAPLLTSNPYIDKVHILSENYAGMIRELRELEYDYILDLHNNLRSSRVKRALKKMFFTVDKLNIPKWLLVNFKINRLPDIHIVDRYLNTARLFDVKNDEEGLDFFIPEEDQVDPGTLPEISGGKYVALVIGAMHATKKMPRKKILDLLGKIKNPVIIIGGPADREEGEQLSLASGRKDLINGCGLWNINQSASVLQHAGCVIAHDTGMMHISAALKKKIITVWGNTVPQFGMYAYLPDTDSKNFEVEGLPCRPCSKLGKKACPKKHFDCMMEQDVDKMAALANAWCD